MAADNPRGAMFRVLVPDRHARVTNAELFFDLVFVFAVTQLSHTLLHHFTPLGVVQVTVLFLAVWWVWVYTTWVTNWLDPDQAPVRILLFLLMLGGLVLSTTIPKAFEERGLWFAIAYASMQVGRTAFWLLATPKHRTPVRHNAIRILAWLCLSALFWILGGLADGEKRLYFWIAALAIEYVSAAARFWTPGLGFSSIEAWAVEGGHMRFRLGGHHPRLVHADHPRDLQRVAGTPAEQLPEGNAEGAGVEIVQRDIDRGLCRWRAFDSRIERQQRRLAVPRIAADQQRR